MSPQIKSLGNTFFLITSAQDVKLFAARAAGDEVAFLGHPYIAPITELETVTHELQQLHTPTSTHQLAYGYELTIYSENDHDALYAAFELFLNDLFRSAIKHHGN